MEASAVRHARGDQLQRDGHDRLADARARAGDATTAGADIRLLSARKLVAHIDGGGKMEIRQALEAAAGRLPRNDARPSWSARRSPHGRRPARSRAWWRSATRVTPAGARAERLARVVDASARGGSWGARPRSRRPTSASSSTSCRCSSRTTPPAPSPRTRSGRAGVVQAARSQHRLAGSVVYKMTETPLPADGEIASTTGAGGATSSGASATSRRRRRTASTWRRGRRPRRSAPPGRSPHVVRRHRRSAGRRSCASRRRSRRAGRPRACRRARWAR